MHRAIPSTRSGRPQESTSAGTPDVAQLQHALDVVQEDAARCQRDLQGLSWIITHDLLEPLRSLRLQTDHLTHALKQSGDLEAARAASGRIQRHGADLWQRMNDVLAFMRVATMAQQRQRVNVHELVESVRSELARRIELANGVVQIEALPEVMADETLMRQLFENLIDNALKFQPPGAHAMVRIRGERIEGDARPCLWRISVEDNGIGFEARHAERIFHPFERLHPAGEYAGTGIGLAISRRIAERHGGTLQATGEPGAGATFVITWPDEVEGT